MILPSLLGANYVDPPVGVRSLAELVGIRGTVSVRELVALLGGRSLQKPFYIIGHNTNSVAKVHSALDAGANAVEVDVTAYEADLSQLCIDHAGVTGDAPGHDGALGLQAFLHDLRTIADSRRQLALVVFDCKPPAATPANAGKLLDAVRSILGSTNLNIMISIADLTSDSPYKLNGTTMFDAIGSDLGPREGLMVDAQSDPVEVALFFESRGITRFCYGNGTSFPLSDEGAMVYRTPIEQACWMRVTRNAPRFVYAWTVNSIDNQELYVRVGVDGIIADDHGVERCVENLPRPEFRRICRPATRADNPFLPANAAYALVVRTSDVGMAGTDANVTFTITGVKGSSAVTVDTNYNQRMERGSVSFVVVPSVDLGELQSVTVQRDDRGNAPDWHLASIDVASLRYHVQKTASFECWVDTTAPFTRQLS